MTKRIIFKFDDEDNETVPVTVIEFPVFEEDLEDMEETDTTENIQIVLEKWVRLFMCSTINGRKYNRIQTMVL
jgi:hypothetical protein